MGLQFYTVKEAASILRISPYTLYRELESGNFKAGRAASSWRITEKDIENYANRDNSTKESQLAAKRKINILSKRIV